jgi:large subunit ribosomal protein L13
MNMANQINRKYHLLNAEGKAPGRVATEAARILRGKHKVDFTPHIDAGDLVVVTNTDRILITGRKADDKKYHRFSGYPGGIRTATLKEMMKKDSTRVIEHAVRGMLPKNKLRDRMLRRLHLYKDDKHEHKIEVTHNA